MVNGRVINENDTLDKLLQEDFERDFIESDAYMILDNYYQMYAPKAATGVSGSKVQTYAQTYANTPNNAYHSFENEGGDCTNFASQALFYGGLGKVFDNYDKTNNGALSSVIKWFYFNNSTSTGYSVTSSWMQVGDLYTFLKNIKGCAVHTGSTASEMSAYLNKGFIMQGKKKFASKYTHSIIITKNSSGSYCYCAHSVNRLNQALSTFYNKYNKYRVIQVY